MTEGFKIAGLILAAGLSRRYGSENKLLRKIDGAPMICRVAQLAEKAFLNPRVLVTGYQAEVIEKELLKENITTIFNTSYGEGMGSSIACGVKALQTETIDAVLVLLGDMPNIDPNSIVCLCNAFNPVLNYDICIPVKNGKQGNTILFGKRFFGELMELSGEEGGKEIIKSNQDCVIKVIVNDYGIHQDIDKDINKETYSITD